MTTNETLIQVFKNSGMKQTEFAISCDTEPVNMHYWLAKKRMIKYSTLEDLCEKHGVKLKISIV